MKLPINIILNQLQKLPLEIHIPMPTTVSFCRAALLPRKNTSMRNDLIHICRLSDALSAAQTVSGMYYLCIRDRIKDSAETEEALQGMVVVNENMEVELLLSQVQELFDEIGEWYRKMQEALIREQSLQQIIDLSESVIGNTINISDSAFTLLARTRNIPTEDPLSLALAKNGHHPYETLRQFREHHRYEVWEQAQSVTINDACDMSPYVLVNKVFRFRNTYFTHVVMVCDHHSITAGLLELFQLLTDILAIYAERNWKDKNALSHNYDSFFQDLIRGNLTNLVDIHERAEYLGLHTEGWFQLMKIVVEPGMEASLGRVGHELADLLPGTQVILHDQSILALIHLHSVSGRLVMPEEQLNTFLMRYDAQAGISNPFTGFEKVASAYQQAALALKYGTCMRGEELLSSLMPLPQSPLIFTFHSRVLHILLGENPQNEQIWEESVYYQSLKNLYEHDLQHKTNNLQLLRIYLWNERKATETANEVHMHRNNVLYRIGRIEKMMGLDLNDHGTRLALEMSFLLMELYGLSPEHTPSLSEEGS